MEEWFEYDSENDLFKLVPGFDESLADYPKLTALTLDKHYSHFLE